MPQMPLSSGEPPGPLAVPLRLIEPEPSFPAGAGARTAAVPWREIEWVGFAPGPDAAEDEFSLPTFAAAPEPAVLGAAGEPPSAARRAHRARRVGPGWRKHIRQGVAHALRLGGAAACFGVVAVFAYQAGDNVTVIAGPMPPAALASANRALQPAGPHVPAAVAALLPAAEAGDAAAQYNIGVLYTRGEAVAQDHPAAAEWFRRAAEGGSAAAQFNLGVMYERGLGVEQDPARAVSLYRLAAERDAAPAQFNLAVAYAEGRGAPQNPALAARWYRAAAGQGLVAAMVNLAILHETGQGAARSMADAYAWYRAAARRGDGAAERRAQELFERFSGPDKVKAVTQAASISATLGDPPAAAMRTAAQPSG